MSKIPIGIWVLKVRAYAATIYNFYNGTQTQSVNIIIDLTSVDNEKYSNEDALLDYIDEQEHIYNKRCEERMRENFSHRLKERQITNFIREEPIVQYLDSMIQEEKRIAGKHYQQMCKSESLLDNRIQTIQFVLEACQSKLNGIVALQLIDRYDTYSSSKDRYYKEHIVIIVEGLYNINRKNNSVRDVNVRKLLDIAKILNFSFFEPNVYFFYSIYISLFSHELASPDNFFFAHMLCSINKVYACLPSSYQFVGLMYFLTRNSYNNRKPLVDEFNVPITKLFDKTEEEIALCGDLVNGILYEMKKENLPNVLSDYFLVLEPYCTEPTGEIKVPKVKLQTATQLTTVVKEVDETFIHSLGPMQKNRNEFTIFRNTENQTTFKVYHSATGKANTPSLIRFFGELSFIADMSRFPLKSEFISAYYTKESITPIIQIQPYTQTIRDYKHSFEGRKEAISINEIFTYSRVADSSLPTLIDFLKTKMKFCLLEISIMHSNGFIHGNIKPDYIVIRDEECHLSDFRFVRRLTDSIITSSYTIPYRDDRMEKEVGMVDFFSDVFALGMTICSMFFFKFENLWEFLDKHLVRRIGFEKYNNIPTIAQYLAKKIKPFDEQLSDLLSKMFASRKYRYTIEECLKHPFYS
jgi:serine/threonine protein kinase